MNKKKIAYFFTILSTIIIVVCLVVLGMRGDFSFHHKKNNVKKMSPELNQKLNEKFEEYSNLENYNGTTVIGMQVTMAQDLFFRYNFYISVKTLKDANYHEYTFNNRYNITDTSNASYINDQNKFLSTIVKDEKGNLVGIKFTEIK